MGHSGRPLLPSAAPAVPLGRLDGWATQEGLCYPPRLLLFPLIDWTVGERAPLMVPHGGRRNPLRSVHNRGVSTDPPQTARLPRTLARLGHFDKQKRALNLPPGHQNFGTPFVHSRPPGITAVLIQPSVSQGQLHWGGGGFTKKSVPDSLHPSDLTQSERSGPPPGKAMCPSGSNFVSALSQTALTRPHFLLTHL